MEFEFDVVAPDVPELLDPEEKNELRPDEPPREDRQSGGDAPWAAICCGSRATVSGAD